MILRQWATSREMATPHNDHWHRLGMLHNSTYYYAVLKKYQSRRRVSLAHQDRTETPAWPRRYLQQPLGTCKLAKHKAGREKGQVTPLLGKCGENIGRKSGSESDTRGFQHHQLTIPSPLAVQLCSAEYRPYLGVGTTGPSQLNCLKDTEVQFPLRMCTGF